MIKNHIVYSVFSDWRFTITGGEGSYIIDDTGRAIIDFTSGWNLANLGWNHPEIIEAVKIQAEKNLYAPMWTNDPIQWEYAKALTATLPKELDAVCRTTGGAESNEVALKIARAATGRKKIIGFQDTFHGQTFAEVGLGTRQEWSRAIAPLVPGFIQVQYPSVFAYGDRVLYPLDVFLHDLEALLKKRDVAAIVAEAGIVTGFGKTLIAPKGFLPAIRKLTKEYGTFFILDEVGTGFSRCGKLFGMELDNVVPDIVTFAKGISNGAAAIGACVVSSKVVEPVIPGIRLVSTFGWTPIACAAAKRVLEIHLRDKLWEQAATNGTFLMNLLKKQLADHPKVGNIRGIGMEIAVTFLKNRNPQTPDEDFAKSLVKKSFENGLHIVHGGDGNIQIMPPLTTSKKVLEKGIEIFLDAVHKVDKHA